jgi:multiple sugar transport system substrate-binding protein
MVNGNDNLGSPVQGQDQTQVLRQSPVTPESSSAKQDLSGQATTYRSDQTGDGENKRPIGKIIKILLGLLVVAILIPVVFYIIFSNFGKNTGGKITLTYWGLWEDQKTVQPIISDFERENPNIIINYIPQSIKQYRETLQTRINNGTGPDIFRFHNTWYPMLSGVLLPLPNDVITGSDFNQTFYPVVQKDLVRNGAIYGIPLEVDTLSLYINTQLLQSVGLTPPTTWNDFINDARAMTVKDENGKIKTAGAAIGTFDNIDHASDILSMLFLQNGVDFKNLSASSDRFNGTLSFYTSFATDQNNVWDNTLDPSTLAFSKGNLAMYFGYSWDYFNIKKFNPNLNFEVVPVPQLPDRTVNMASYWAEGVSSKSKNQKQAFLFMKFLVKNTTEEKLYAEESKVRAFGEPYARVDLSDTLKSNPNVYTFVSQAKTASSTLFVDKTFDNGLNQQLNTYLGNAVNSVLSNGSTQTAFDVFLKGVSQILQKYGQ